MTDDRIVWFFTLVLFCVTLNTQATQTIYQIGVGRADVTGPAAEIVLHGYGNFEQSAAGIHTRLYSRAFIIGDSDRNRAVFVSVDVGMISHLVRMQVIKHLRRLYGDQYTDTNLCISSTHTHSGPGGFMEHLFYNIPIKGFVRQSMEAIVQGVVRSIQLAHENIRPGYITKNVGNLEGANINRSPVSYLQNPEAERALYDSDTDHQMVLLKLTDETTGQPIGMINWFAVHCTSMNSTNLLISSDNKGIASLLFERRMDPESLVGRSKFVAAFAQANEGDVSPNTKGAICQDTGKACDAITSTCDGMSKMCYALGPGRDMFESTRIIGEKQFDKAWELFESANIPICGPVKTIHQYLDMSNVEVKLNETVTVRTCPGAMGHSFAAGTTDGPGMFDFKQHTPIGHESTMWNVVRNLLKTPSQQMVDCHKPKAILLELGVLDMPYDWVPSIVSTQIMQIGNFAIAAVPAEFTTMAGRRLRNAVRQGFSKGSNDNDVHVVISGLSNTYASYVTTFEEYQFQRYEGGSTLYGPHTLQAYLQQYEKLAEAMEKGESLNAGPPPPDLLNSQISLVPPVIVDTSPLFSRFGRVTKDAQPEYAKGSLIEVTFVSGNPRNALMLECTFLTIEREDKETGKWAVIATDADWETKFIWRQTNSLLGQSEATVHWQTDDDTKPGTYRIRHFGYHKNLFSRSSPYQGLSRNFTIL